jgi:putative PEP-CTERM system TPR-repeat lipoprotein
LEASSALDAKYYQADIALALYHLEQGQFDKALAAITALEKKLPNSPGTYNLKGLAYMGKKDFPQARRNFERALTLNPTLVSAAVNLGKIDLQEKNLPAARSRLQGIVDKDSKNVSAMIALAELARLEKKEPQYLSWLEKAARANPAAFRPRALMAEYYLGEGQQEKALGIAREAVAGRSDSLEALELLGRVQLAAGEKDNAFATYTKLAALAPKSARVHYNLAQTHAAQGDEKATRSALRQALELNPSYADALAALSVLEARTGNHTEAVGLARELQERFPSSPTGLTLEGDAWMAAGRYADAAQSYQKSLATDKSSAAAIKLHLAHARGGDVKKADTFLLDWLKARPGDKVVRTYLAESYGERKQNARAIEQYEILLKAAPKSAVLLNNLAMLYQQQKDPRALPSAEQAYKQEPKNPAIADTLGWILVEQGKVARGLDLLSKAKQAAPRAPEIRYHYAAALAKSGDEAKARAELKSLLSKADPFPQRAAAEELLARLQR